MIDFEKMLADLKAEAAKVAEQVELDAKLEKGKDMADDVRERLETDPKARMAAAGAGGLLLAGLLGTRGGRSLVGGVAKTGAVAALGALAYHAWQTREGAAGTEADANAEAAGYITDDMASPQFSEALIRVMVAAAHADGHLDATEQAAIADALTGAGVSDEARAVLLAGGSEVDAIDAAVLAAQSPNHSAQIYAAASAVAGGGEASERDFLNRLAARLGLSEQYAASIDNAAL
ncbi:MAG: DUF533 domain-containing protein [Hyphomonadaceae bacterium]